MTTHRPTTSRRTVLRTAAATAAGLSLSGCLGIGPLGSAGATNDVVLDEPENYERLADADVEYPIHAEELPEATATDPITDREVSTRGFVGERHVLSTFIFTRCPGVCPALTSNLRQVQADAADQGYETEVALLAFTFDPEYDTPERLREYGEDHGVDFDAGNWHFLRPETPDRAKEVVEDRLGVFFDELSEQDRKEMDMHEDMAFEHRSLILLANVDGYVERAYTGGDIPNPSKLIEDVHTLRERW